MSDDQPPAPAPGRGRGREGAPGDVRETCAHIEGSLQALVAGIAGRGQAADRAPALRRAMGTFLSSPFVRLHGLQHAEELFEFSATLTPTSRSLCRVNCYDLDATALRTAFVQLGGRGAQVDPVAAIGQEMGARLALGVDFPPERRERRLKCYVFLWEPSPDLRPLAVERAVRQSGAPASCFAGVDLERASALGFDFRPGQSVPELKVYLRFSERERRLAALAGAGHLKVFSEGDVDTLCEDPYVAARMSEILVCFDVGPVGRSARAAQVGLRAQDGWPERDADFVERHLSRTGLARHLRAVSQAYLRAPFRQLCYISLTRSRSGERRSSLYFLTATAGRRGPPAGNPGSAAALPGTRFSFLARAGAVVLRVYLRAIAFGRPVLCPQLWLRRGVFSGRGRACPRSGRADPSLVARIAHRRR